MEEYISMDHNSLITTQSRMSYYLLHHDVPNNNSDTTKLRVVFNDSEITRRSDV